MNCILFIFIMGLVNKVEYIEKFRYLSLVKK